ncbi:DUF3429 domain-containing protein [Dichotomicrobium thermohalophilum]|uniref:Uncharacterized protein DUF3429 n=1 Tax=Dichotomicrobium thermohalophilum TaxID=933063 RepID=A0A397PF52_9HYPH|nr:DUF3429 domain-containing protein [Dichotomicrobium thermohalophilum]RIA47588.1 uncharacterized protein DUF3429 [Dichotomicrobium thermohalophilum]
MNERVLARILTFAGALPFIAAVVALPFAPAEATASIWQAVLGYGAVIASFVSGIHWGLFLYRNAALPLNLFISSNICALAAWATLLLPSLRLALLLLIAVFAALFAIDHTVWRAGGHEAWFYQLRAAITAIVIAALIVLLLMA